MRRLALAFLVGAAVGLGCARLSAPPPAPAPTRVFASFVVRNDMPVPIDIYITRAGWADSLIRRRLGSQQLDTIDTHVQPNAAFRLLAISPDDQRFWSESSIIFAVSPFRFSWRVRTPLYLREQRRSANQKWQTTPTAK